MTPRFCRDSVTSVRYPCVSQLPTEQLTSVRRLLKKLQFMFELPSRMRRAIALDALAEAVQYPALIFITGLLF